MWVLAAVVFLSTIQVVSSVCPFGCTCTINAGNVTGINCDGMQLITLPTIPATTISLSVQGNALGSWVGQPFNQLSALQTLDVSSNPISALVPGMLVGLSSLQSLVVSYTTIRELVANQFDAVKSTLTQLYLNDNLIGTVDERAFSGMTELQTLDLRNNKVAVLATGVFADLVALRTLVLRDNLLGINSNVPGAILLSANVHLDIVDMSNNNIESLPPTIFRTLSRLTRLDLAGNPWQDLSPALFESGLSSLTTLYVNTNARGRLESLGNGTFSNLPAITRIRVAGAHWNCCGLEWLVEVVAVEDLVGVQCRRPALALGQSLTAAMAAASVPGTIERCAATLPDSPVAPLASGITSTSADIAWLTVHGNAYAVLSYQIQYAKCNNQSCDFNALGLVAQCASGEVPTNINANQAVQDCHFLPRANVVAGNTMSHTVASLDPYTDYCVRIIAINTLGSSYGEPLCGVTSAESVPSAAGVTLAATATGITAAVTPPSVPAGIVTAYKMSVMNATSGEKVAVDVVVDGGATEIEFKTNIIPFTNYSVQVSAATSAGYGAVTLQDISTAQTTPLAGLVAPTLVSTEPFALVVSWSALAPSRRNGLITAEYLSVVVAGSGDTPVDKCTVSGNGALGVRTCTISTLSPATQYAIAVAFATTPTLGGPEFRGAPSPLLLATTLDSAPGPMLAPRVTVIDQHNVHVAYVPPVEPNGNIVKYEVQVTDGQGGIQHRNITSFASMQVNITGLTTYTVYNFSIRGFTYVLGDYRAGPYSPSAQVRTAAGVPSAVTCTTTSLGSRSINVSWTFPELANGVITNFSLTQIGKEQIIKYYSPVKDASVNAAFASDDNRTMHTVVSNLSPYTAYTFVASASTTSGGSTGNVACAGRTDMEAPVGQPAPKSVRAHGHSVIELAWGLAAQPNGELHKFIITTTKDGATAREDVLAEDVVFNASMFYRNMSGLEESSTYSFAVSACNRAGDDMLCSGVSASASQETSTTSPSVTTSIVIALLCAVIVILSVGFVWEHEIGRSEGAHFSHDFDGVALNPFERSSTDPFVNAGDVTIPPHFHDDDSDSGSSYGAEEVARPSLASLASLGNIARNLAEKRRLSGNGGMENVGIPETEQQSISSDKVQFSEQETVSERTRKPPPPTSMLSVRASPRVNSKSEE